MSRPLRLYQFSINFRLMFHQFSDSFPASQQALAKKPKPRHACQATPPKQLQAKLARDAILCQNRKTLLPKPRLPTCADDASQVKSNSLAHASRATLAEQSAHATRHDPFVNVVDVLTSTIQKTQILRITCFKAVYKAQTNRFLAWRARGRAKSEKHYIILLILLCIAMKVSP